jgi:hypothetical protein
MGFTVVDNDGLSQFSGQSQLLLESLALDRPGRPVTIVIQPDLADGHHFWVLSQGSQLFQNVLIQGLRLVGMDAYRSINLGVGLGQGHPRLAGFQSGPGVDDGLHPSFLSASDDLLAVRVELGEVQVGMAIY